MDEPTADLDPVARQELLDVLRDFVADGEKSVFFSTLTSDLDKVADYITIIHRGRILETMSMDQLEKSMCLQGGIEQLKSLDRICRIKRYVTFEGIITRDKANKFFPDIKGSKPNVESILTYSIWGDSNGEVKKVLKFYLYIDSLKIKLVIFGVFYMLFILVTNYVQKFSIMEYINNPDISLDSAINYTLVFMFITFFWIIMLIDYYRNKYTDIFQCLPIRKDIILKTNFLVI